MALNQGFTPKPTELMPSNYPPELYDAVRNAIQTAPEDASSDDVTGRVMEVVGSFMSANATHPMIAGAQPVGGAPLAPMVAGNNPGNYAITAFNRGAPNERTDPNVSPASDMHGVGAFARHPDLGHVIGIENAPIPASAATEYPKWIEPHESWVQSGANGTPMAPLFPDQHVDWSDRANPRLMVMVASREDEDRATAQQQEQEAATDSAAERNPPNAGIGGGDPTGTKTLYPAGNEDAENADPAGFAERSADLNAERNEGEESEADKAERERLEKVAKSPRKTK